MINDQIKVIGFSGTRNGLTVAQRDSLIRELGSLRPEVGVHGDCVGADEEFDQICKEQGIRVHIRPCTYPRLRAFCESEVIAEEKAPMARNRDIVVDADHMIACPPNKKRIKSGSGTWATIGFAERLEVDLTIIYPDGTRSFQPGGKRRL
jgi:hypothetical protein